MEFRHLRYYIALAETLHFGQAAARLRIAQPTLSQQIRQLEEELGSMLLARSKRRVELTGAGQVFLEQAREILARAEHAALLARRAGGAEEGKLRVGVAFMMDVEAIAALVSAFRERHARVQVELLTVGVAWQMTSLLQHRLDVGFVRPPVRDPTLRSRVLVRERLVAALPLSHRASKRRRLALASLAGDPFIVVPGEPAAAFRDLVLRACRDAGFAPQVAFEADHLPLVLRLVAEGAGVALVPAFARTMRPHGVAFAVLSPAVTVETAIAWRRSSVWPLVAEFVASAQRALSRR